MDINGRFFARVVMYIAGVAFLVLAGFSYQSDRITARDVIGLGVTLVVGAVAALWLWRHPSPGRRS